MPDITPEMWIADAAEMRRNALEFRQTTLEQAVLFLLGQFSGEADHLKQALEQEILERK